MNRIKQEMLDLKAAYAALEKEEGFYKYGANGASRDPHLVSTSGNVGRHDSDGAGSNEDDIRGSELKMKAHTETQVLVSHTKQSTTLSHATSSKATQDVSHPPNAVSAGIHNSILKNKTFASKDVSQTNLKSPQSDMNKPLASKDVSQTNAFSKLDVASTDIKVEPYSGFRVTYISNNSEMNASIKKKWINT